MFTLATMGRPKRDCPGGYVYHVLNRANARATLFDKAGDYAAFLRVLAETQQRHPLRLLAFCLMPTHWHLLFWPEDDGQVSPFLHDLTLTHTRAGWPTATASAAATCTRAASSPSPSAVTSTCSPWPATSSATPIAPVWRSGPRTGRGASLWQRLGRPVPPAVALSAWPMPLPEDWIDWVNTPQTEAEVLALRECVKRGRPMAGMRGCDRRRRDWTLTPTLRPRGRPRKQREGGEPGGNYLPRNGVGRHFMRIVKRYATPFSVSF